MLRVCRAFLLVNFCMEQRRHRSLLAGFLLVYDVTTTLVDCCRSTSSLYLARLSMSDAFIRYLLLAKCLTGSWDDCTRSPVDAACCAARVMVGTDCIPVWGITFW